MWLAHYSFHFLTGIGTVVPVVQDLLLNVGIPLLGEPMWTLTGMPEALVYPLELGFVGLGLMGSLLVGYHISERDYADEAWSAYIPWAVLCVILWAVAMWLLSQPMEMRGTFLGG